MKRLIRLVIAIIIPVAILFIPTESIPIAGLTIAEHRVIALFAMAALFWILEPIPMFSTSLLIIGVELFFISDKGLRWFRVDDGNLGQLLSYKDIMATFADPIIILFLGGFFLALAATKYRLDTNLARVMLKPFGKKPCFVMLGLMIITAVFSMFMSNTATTAMMLAVLAPVLKLIDENDKAKTAFALSIPVAANVGGMGTPIGTPPNTIALKYLIGENSISFGEWMLFGIPYVIVLLLFAWILLVLLYPTKQKEINLDIKGTFLKTKKAKIVYFTFIATVLLWLTGPLHGMNSYVVATIPIVIFSITKVITKEDIKSFSWDVLWLVSGGIALGLAMQKTGLAQHFVQAIPFNTFNPIAIVLIASFLTYAMANFMSHTATANLLMPVIAILAASLTSLDYLGGAKMLILCVTFSASLGMTLPISTPPNALAHGTGYTTVKDMSRVGLIIGLTGIAMTYLLCFILNQVGFM